MMARPCTTCTHPKRRSINRALKQGDSIRQVSEAYGPSKSSVSRHAHECLGLGITSEQKNISGQKAARIMGQAIERSVPFHVPADAPSSLVMPQYTPLPPAPLTLEKITTAVNGRLGVLPDEPSPRDLIHQAVNLIEQAFRLAAPEDYEALGVLLHDGLSGVNYGLGVWE